MDIRVLNQLPGALNGSNAVVSVPVDTRVVLSEIASSESITDVERSSLIAAVSQVDSYLVGIERSVVLEQIQRLGIYLRNSGTDGYPRWPMMTALRAYGMNLTNDGGGQTSVVANLRGQLEQIAQGRGVSLEKAIAAAAALPAPHVELKVESPESAETGVLVEKLV